MANITDKFGKASISTNYALATTVKTARTVGESVLACYDLSRFSQSTPVFFVTYKKTTNPTTNVTTVTNQTSWKAIVNPDNNTLTNLTLAPGYTDIGNDIGDFVECIPTSFWGNSLVEGIEAHANPDGTLKTTAVQAALNLPSGAQADWTPLATAPSLTASNGQREFQLTYTGVDYTDRLQPGTRLKIPRTVTPTTQCTSLNGTNQYWVDTTPAGMTFTDDFVVSAWVKLSSYADATIVSRYNGTSGWELLVLANGTLLLRGFNGGIDNISSVASYQSVPLNKWIHVTGQLDMSAFTATTTTSYLMLDGVDIPSIVARSGTNPTSLVQAGDLQVGARNGTLLFPGKIAHVAIYGAKVSQQTIRDTMNKKLAGTETNLVAYFPMDGNGNDLTANNNVLVGMNSATATSLDNPMNATEYAIITKVAKPAADTLVTAFCPSGTGLPNQSLGVSSYSTARAPYGFPSSRRLWSVSFVQMAQRMFGSVTNGVYYSAQSLVIPTGEWTVNANFRDFVTSNAVAYLLHVRTMSSSSSSAAWFPGGDQPILARMFIAVTNAEIGHSSSVFGTIVASSPTTLYGVQHTLNGAGVVNVYSETSVITAECAYL